MHFKTLTLAAIASAVSAQNLSAALGSIPSLSQLGQYLRLYPNVEQFLANTTNVTILAPNNAAFAKFLSSAEGQAFQQQASDQALIEAFFSYHVLDGVHYANSFNSTPQFIPTTLSPATNLTLLQPGAAIEAVRSEGGAKILSGLLTESNVISANHNFTGGVIHVIDTFLSLPQNISATLVALNLTAAAGALETAQIAKGPLPNNLTAFIPNNAAFEAISSALTNLSIANLTGILGYHLVPNVVAYSTDLSNNMSLPTIANRSLTVRIDGSGDVFINSARVLVPNVLVQEGVVHVIDEVLNPNQANNTNSTNSSSSSGQHSSTTTANFPGASSGNVPYTSGITAPSSVPAAATATTGAGSAVAPSATASASESASGSGNAAAGVVKPLATGAAALVGAAAMVVMGL